jgi:hypothetical protein
MSYTDKVINETPPMATRSRIGIELPKLTEIPSAALAI